VEDGDLRVGCGLISALGAAGQGVFAGTVTGVLFAGQHSDGPGSDTAHYSVSIRGLHSPVQQA
jgi:hypothetical protein